MIQEPQKTNNVTIVVESMAGRKVESDSQTGDSLRKNTRGRKTLKKILGVLLLIILVLGGLFSYRAFSLSSQIFVGRKTTFIQKVQGLFRGSPGSVRLVGEDVGQINVLLLGIGGEGHDGPYLSDTIILAQVRPDLKSISMTSIPRDYLTNIPGYGFRKINAAFAEGYNKNKDYDEAGRYAREAVEKLSGTDIPYFAVIDFKGFEEAINKVGGLDIEIDRTFTDYTYPDEKDGYLPAQTFKQGKEHMDGKRALIFSRSRHAAGPEGSDFARSQRQQKIIKAFKDKVVSLNLISDAGTINNLAGTFASHFHTNINPSEVFRLYNLIKDYDKSNIFALSLDPVTKLICPKILEETGAYVLSPCPGKTDTDIKNFFKNSFVIGAMTSEKPTIWIAANSEDQLGYKELKNDLINAGLTVLFVKTTNATESTSVFEVNPKPKTVEYLKQNYGLRVALNLPEGFKVSKDKVDLVILLAQSENNKNQ